jgi:hypothetical protein
MQRNTKVIAAVGLIPEPRELRAVCRGRVFLDDIKGVSLTTSHRVFRAVLEIDGSITVSGHSWRDGFPSYPLAAVRNLQEGRKLLDPVKPTGGWPYWHYLDEISGEWENLSHLWQRTLTQRCPNSLPVVPEP